MLTGALPPSTMRSLDGPPHTSIPAATFFRVSRGRPGNGSRLRPRQQLRNQRSHTGRESRRLRPHWERCPYQRCCRLIFASIVLSGQRDIRCLRRFQSCPNRNLYAPKSKSILSLRPAFVLYFRQGSHCQHGESFLRAGIQLLEPLAAGFNQVEIAKLQDVRTSGTYQQVALSDWSASVLKECQPWDF